MKKMLAMFVGGLAATVFAEDITSDNTLTVDEVSFKQESMTRDIAVSYRINRDACVWFDVLTNNVSIGRERIKSVDGEGVSLSSDDVKAAGTHTFVWHARKDWADQICDVTIRVEAAYPGEIETFWNYLVYDLSSEPYAVTGYQVPPVKTWTREYKTTKLVFRRISAGTFLMGSPTTESGRNGGATGTRETQHKVRLTQPYYIGVFELTRAQYAVIRAPDGFPTLSGYSYYPGMDQEVCPVAGVTKNVLRGTAYNATYPATDDVSEASLFGRLRARATPAPAGYIFDLPTEAQWEYACRAGTTGKYNNGTEDEAGLKELAQYNGSVYFTNNGSNQNKAIVEVGLFAPNAWGLYDMHGNVWEWVRDLSADFTAQDQVDPYGPTKTGSTSGNESVMKGGGCIEVANDLRSARRNWTTASANQGKYGCRLAIVPAR